MEYIKLYNGVQMPTLGYGVFLVSLFGFCLHFACFLLFVLYLFVFLLDLHYLCSRKPIKR